MATDVSRVGWLERRIETAKARLAQHTRNCRENPELGVMTDEQATTFANQCLKLSKGFIQDPPDMEKA